MRANLMTGTLLGMPSFCISFSDSKYRQHLSLSLDTGNMLSVLTLITMYL